MKKTYVSTKGAQITFPVKVAGKVKWVSFNGRLNDFTTSNVELQNAIETCKRFIKKDIELINGLPNAPVAPAEDTVVLELIKPEDEKDIKPEDNVDKESVSPITGETGDGQPENKTYPNVTDLQGAIRILKTEFNVAHQSLRSPENVQKKIEELGISFPNLK
jgi:hypothetical protein